MLKYLLLPLTLIYGCIVWLRNRLYDGGVLASYKSHIPAVVIGNLQAGGSGKTPLTAYLYRKLKANYRISILSRGYGRRSRGLIEAVPGTGPDIIGDEPYWYFTTLPDARVLVSEKRVKGIRYMEEQKQTDLILLDDAFQHRAVQGDIYILLTDFAKPYYDDMLLPSGRLREQTSGAARAGFILVSKCPAGLTTEEKQKILAKIKPSDRQEVYFTSIATDGPVPITDAPGFRPESYNAVLAVSGIARPESFEQICKEYHPLVRGMRFKDHYVYTSADVKKISAACPPDTALICTEKDAVKLMQPGLREHLPHDRMYILPVHPVFLFGEEQKFLMSLQSELNNVKRK